MRTTTHDREAETSPWFVSWFDSTYYHKLYGYRDESEAAGFIDTLLSRLHPAAGSVALDLGCGTGRHSRYLASKGFRVIGMDLADSSIKKAKASLQPGTRFIQHDMREPFGKTSVDYVFSFFTSFGYFDDPAEHLAVVRNIADSLRKDGVLMLDYLNVGYAQANLKPQDEFTIDGIRYRVKRYSASGYFFKRIVVEDLDGQLLGNYSERVAKFSVQDFKHMFGVYGLSIDSVYGDYALSSYDPETSPRMILIATKKHVGEGNTAAREGDVSEVSVFERASCEFC
jgi:SAM-dependent methyltransferase